MYVYDLCPHKISNAFIYLFLLLNSLVLLIKLPRLYIHSFSMQIVHFIFSLIAAVNTLGTLVYKEIECKHIQIINKIVSMH
jgi:hypothetical protein